MFISELTNKETTTVDKQFIVNFLNLYKFEEDNVFTVNLNFKTDNKEVLIEKQHRINLSFRCGYTECFNN